MSKFYSPTTNLRIEQQTWLAYGPFAPDTMARSVRWENADLGLKTCWNPHCLKGFEPKSFIDADGKRHQPGRGRLFCSRACARAAREYKAELFSNVTFSSEKGVEL